MTQRYKITTQLTPTLNGGYDVVAIAVPDDQGDYVRHDAVSHLTKEQINKALNNIKIEGVYPCSVIEADFERDEVTLKMQGDYKVIAGPMLLVRADSVADDKALEQHRAEFEEWVASEFKGGVLDKEMIARYAGNNDLYHHAQTSQLWRAWQAARGLKP